MELKTKGLALKKLGGSIATFYASWATFTGKAIVVKYLDSKGKSHTKKCKRADAVAGWSVRWDYMVMLANGKTKWVTGSASETSARNDTFSAPAEALKVRVTVKPVPKQYTSHKKKGTKKDGKKTVPNYVAVKKNWFTGKAAAKDGWADSKTILPPETPEASVAGDTSISVRCTANDPYVDKHECAVEQYTGGKWVRVFTLSSTSASQSRTFTANGLQAGGTYRAAHRTRRENGKWSAWSPWTAYVLLRPPRPAKAPSLAARVEGVLASWGACQGAQEYEVAWAETANQLGSSSQMSTASQGLTSIVLAVQVGRTVYAKVRAKNSTGEGPWSAVAGPLKYGTRPNPPTVWSAASAVVRGSAIVLCWAHNSTDDSAQTAAEVSVNTGSGWATARSVAGAMSVELPSAAYADGTTLQWRVRTKGIVDQWSDWSETRAVRVWEQPTLVVAAPATVETLPIAVTVDPHAPSQWPVAADVSIVAAEEHTVSNPDGTERVVRAGEAVWSAHFDEPPDPLVLEISAGDVSLASPQAYTVRAVCAMSSGLSCENSAGISTDFADVEFTLACDIDPNGKWAAEIEPYALVEADDGSASHAPVRLAVYRHETDGTMTALVRNMPNDGTYSFIDTHAPFGTARYRAVATVEATGQVAYADAEEDVIDSESILIQWGDSLSEVEHAPDGEAVGDDRPAATCLELFGNIEMAETREPDVALVEYIGRRHPVPYYGTQLGQTADWSCVIEKDDEDSLALLREIAAMGEPVYVREPLGDGYWAHVAPSWSSSYSSGLVKVSLSVTRIDKRDECEVVQ